MELIDMVHFAGGQLVLTLPSLIGWTAALVVAVLLKLRGGGKPVSLLIVGSALMLAGALLRLPLAVLPPLLMNRGWTASDAAAAMSMVGLGVQLVQLGGIVCLVYAFWLQFHVSETLRPASQSTL